MSMPNGEDPKNPKAQSEVKVTAKRPAAEPPKKQYTWDDVSRNIDIQERNKAKKAQYESDVANYNKAMKLYREGPGAPSNVGQKLATGKLRGGETASFEQADYTPAEKSNKMLREQLKRGELVSVDDPSLDPTTRKLLRGTMLGSMGEGQTDILGTGGKIYVPKGTKYSSYKEIYGEDFNPEEFVAASRSGKFDEYSKKKGYTGRAFAPNISFYQEYKEPEQVKTPEYEKEESIDFRNVAPPEKLPQLKPNETFENINTGKNVGKIVKKGYGKLETYKAPAPEEKADFTDPSRARITTKYKKTGVASNASRGGRGVGSGSTMKLGNYQTGRNILKKDVAGREYEREAKMAKAYFGGGFEGKGEAGIAETKASLKADKASLKEGIKEIRRGKASPSPLDKSDRIAGLRAAKKDVKAEIKQAKQASKYLGKLGGDKETGGVSEGQKFKNTGKIKYYTPEAMKGFAGSKQDTFDPEANFKSQLNNPANRNTISAQEKTLTFKEKLASEREARKNAPSFKERRAAKKASRDLQRDVERKMGI